MPITFVEVTQTILELLQTQANLNAHIVALEEELRQAREKIDSLEAQLVHG